MPRNFFSIDDWTKAQKADAAAAADARVFKQFAGDVQKAAEAERTYTFVLSTAAPDRHGDTVCVDGWILDAYQKNPVVLLAHNYSQPAIGRSVRTWVEAQALRGVMEFAPKGVYPLADTVEALVGAGFMRAVSVGFRPMPNRYVYNEERRGYDILQQELLEYSVVPVPAHPDALQEAKSAGIDLGPLRKNCEEVLDGIEPGLWIPKALALRVMQLTSGEAKSLVVPAPAPTAPATPEPTKEAFRPTAHDFKAALTAAIESTESVVTERVNHVLGRLGD